MRILAENLEVCPLCYLFDSVPTDYAYITPRSGLAETKVPDATPGAIAMYALDDEQAVLARVRYNRLIDIFMGVASYSLQSHLRTQVGDIGQVETDEVYVGIDRHSIVQIEQDIAMCKAKFENCIRVYVCNHAACRATRLKRTTPAAPASSLGLRNLLRHWPGRILLSLVEGSLREEVGRSAGKRNQPRRDERYDSPRVLDRPFLAHLGTAWSKQFLPV